MNINVMGKILTLNGSDIVASHSNEHDSHISVIFYYTRKKEKKNNCCYFHI